MTSKNKVAVQKPFDAHKNNTVRIQLEFHSLICRQSVFKETVNNISRAGSNICETLLCVFKI